MRNVFEPENRKTKFSGEWIPSIVFCRIDSGGGDTTWCCFVTIVSCQCLSRRFTVMNTHHYLRTHNRTFTFISTSHTHTHTFHFRSLWNGRPDWENQRLQETKRVHLMTIPSTQTRQRRRSVVNWRGETWCAPTLPVKPRWYSTRLLPSPCFVRKSSAHVWRAACHEGKYSLGSFRNLQDRPK